MLGDIIRTAMGFAGIWAARAQIKQQWLPAWGPARPPQCCLRPGRPAQGVLSLRAGLTGFAEGWAWGPGSQWLPLPPISSHIPALLFVHCEPQCPTAPQTWSRAGSLLSSRFSPFLCRGGRDPRAAQGPKVTLAGRCSIWLLEALWPWWCGDGHGPPGRGRWRAGG